MQEGILFVRGGWDAWREFAEGEDAEAEGRGGIRRAEGAYEAVTDEGGPREGADPTTTASSACRSSSTRSTCPQAASATAPPRPTRPSQAVPRTQRDATGRTYDATHPFANEAAT